MNLNQTIRNGMQSSLLATMLAVGLAATPTQGAAQQGATAAPHQAGTVKATTATGLTLTTAAGQDVAVSVPDAAKILVVAPGSKDLKSATSGALGDIATGDKVIVMGSAGDAPSALTATRVILMKSSAIEQAHAAEDAAWAQGGGGLVKAVDIPAGKIIVSHGLKTLTVITTPTTVVRRYSGDSVRFADAQVSTLSAIRPGDQLRVRGTKSDDGNTITADELVTGTFRNYSGLIASINATAGTITLKDLATKKTVTVLVTSNSDVHRVPPMVAMRIAAQMKAGATAKPGSGQPSADAPSDAQRAGRAGMDLSQMISRLPTETLGGLKVGDAVMIVATSPSADSTKSTAITLLAGVDAILTAAPNGQSMTLSPWSIGGSGGDGADAGGVQ